jgi:hypothetical protein
MLAGRRRIRDDVGESAKRMQFFFSRPRNDDDGTPFSAPRRREYGGDKDFVSFSLLIFISRRSLVNYAAAAAAINLTTSNFISP